MSELWFVKRSARISRFRYYTGIPTVSLSLLKSSNDYYATDSSNPVGWWSLTSGGIDTYLSYRRNLWPYNGGNWPPTTPDEEIDIVGYPDNIWTEVNAIWQLKAPHPDRPDYESPGQRVPPGEWQKYFTIDPYTSDEAFFVSNWKQGLPFTFQEEGPAEFWTCGEPYRITIIEGVPLSGGGGVTVNQSMNIAQMLNIFPKSFL